MAKAKLTPGMVIDGFTLVERLHKGGMAHLWRVTHENHARTSLLMKVPKLAEGEDPAAIVSFEMEMMILPRLSGPHVPRFVAVGTLATQPYLVMEEITGSTLLPKLKELPLDAAEVADIGARIARALDSLHRQDVIHLDLKPSNIMFRETGEAVLLDFGLSHHTGLPDLMKEQFRLPYGTAPYMAPEQVLGVRNYRRSDVFALGVLLYFFATAVRPFGDPQTLKGLKERLWRDPHPPRHWRKDIPDWLQEVILRCLEPNPEKRYPTAAQLGFDLRHPAQVRLTARATKARQDGWLATMRRKHNPDTFAPARKLATQSQIGASPIVAVAIDLREQSSELADALRAQVRLAMQSSPNCRVACVNVLKQSAISNDTSLDADGASRHIKRLVALEHWARPLGLPQGAVTFHVLESTSPPDAILDYARTNHVDHIIMGARAESLKRNMLGSVSAQVAAHAPCTVSVVRQRVWPDAEPETSETLPVTA
jgi:eukaryotic-like serine/threonine-protein kinase